MDLVACLSIFAMIKMRQTVDASRDTVTIWQVDVLILNHCASLNGNLDIKFRADFLPLVWSQMKHHKPTQITIHFRELFNLITKGTQYGLPPPQHHYYFTAVKGKGELLWNHRLMNTKVTFSVYKLCQGSLILSCRTKGSFSLASIFLEFWPRRWQTIWGHFHFCSNPCAIVHSHTALCVMKRCQQSLGWPPSPAPPILPFQLTPLNCALLGNPSVGLSNNVTLVHLTCFLCFYCDL